MGDKPIVKNEYYEIEITGVNADGQGIGRINDFVVFVDGLLAGERARIKIIKVSKSFAVGKTVEILSKSENRVEAFCKMYHYCGGCNFQHLSYEAQLGEKQKQVKDVLARIGGMEQARVDELVEPCKGMERPFEYRNKVQYPFSAYVDRDGSRQVVAGFYAPRSHRVVAHDECRIQEPVCEAIKQGVLNFVVENDISVYDSESGEGLMRHLLIRTGTKTRQLMVVFVLNGKKLKGSKALIEQLSKIANAHSYELKSVYINVNKQRSNVILGEKCIKLLGEDYIYESIGDKSYRISPLSFFQVNSAQCKVLYDTVKAFAQLTGEEKILDLYCGTGTIGIYLADAAREIVGVEVIEQAVWDAKANAEANGVTNASFFCGTSEDLAQEWASEEGAGEKADLVVLDPPRKGCDIRLLESLDSFAKDRVVYVSCDPATLARDVKILEAKGWRVEKVQPVDMFGWTGHVETVCLLRK